MGIKNISRPTRQIAIFSVRTSCTFLKLDLGKKGEVLRKATGFRFDFGHSRPFIRPSIAQNDEGNAKTPRKKKRVLKRTISPKIEILGDKAIFHMPIVTVSEANNFEHWTKKHKRHKLQKQIVQSVMKMQSVTSYPQGVVDVWRFVIPCHIKLTRIAPGTLDRWDNLPMSLKYVLDAICAVVTGDYRPGRADDNEGITVSYDQKFCKEYGVILEFQNLDFPSTPARNDEALN